MNPKPHHSHEAERGLLGSVMRNNAILDDLIELVPDDFSVWANGELWRLTQGLRSAGLTVDTVTLAEALGTTERLKDIGGAEYLVRLFNEGADQKHAQACARIIKRHSITRQVIATCQQIIADADSRTMKPDELIDHAEKLVFDIGQRGHANTVYSHSQVIDESLDLLARRVEMVRRGETSGALPYGLADLDRATAGMHAGELVLVAARPGVGKTILGCHLADTAGSGGYPCLFVCLEQARTELALRLLAKHSTVNAFKLRSGVLGDDELGTIREAAERVREMPIWWDDVPGQTVWRIASQARKLKAKHGLSLLVVDYLQLIQAHNPKQKRHEQVGEISRALKLLARDLKIPVVAMAQLNRESETNGSEPKLSQLRESGDLEQNADTVILLHPQGPSEFGGQPVETQQIKLLIRKQRNGPITDVTIVHDKPRYALRNFEDYTRHLP